MNKALKFVIWLVAVAVILFFVTDMPHIFGSARIAARMAGTNSILRNISNANSIYMNDYDGRFFPATSMSTVRALLQPYEKQIFSQGVNKYSSDSKKFSWSSHDKFSEPYFNFNLAGLSSSDALNPMGFGAVDHHEIMVFFINDSELNGISALDIDSRPIRSHDSYTLNSEDFLRKMSYQFDRKGVTLFPPNYPADQDPLKER